MRVKERERERERERGEGGREYVAFNERKKLSQFAGDFLNSKFSFLFCFFLLKNVGNGVEEKGTLAINVFGFLVFDIVIYWDALQAKSKLYPCKFTEY